VLQAAELGLSVAMCRVGTFYVLGYGTERNFVKAREWLQKAVDRHDADAKNVLGLLLIRGYGGEKNVLIGIKLLNESDYLTQNPLIRRAVSFQ
jgi:TPR repeat protein